MPSVAVYVCQGCGCTDKLTLVGRQMLTAMSPCSCGGHMQVARVFYDRRIRDESVLMDGGLGDAAFVDAA